MVRFFVLLGLVLSALLLASTSGLFAGVALMVAGMTAIGLAVSLYADLGGYS
jgi:hypothetical protein